MLLEHVVNLEQFRTDEDKQVNHVWRELALPETIFTKVAKTLISKHSEIECVDMLAMMFHAPSRQVAVRMQELHIMQT